MSYKISAKNRKFKRFLLNIIGILKFESFNTSPYHKIIIIGILINILSLFLNWVDSSSGDILGNSFYDVLGLTGYILLFINLKLLFIIFNEKLKDTIKNYFNINIKDGLFIIFLGFFNLILTINSIFIIQGFSIFSTNIIIGQGIILSIIGSIFVIIGGIFLLKIKTNTSVYVEGKIDEENITSITDIKNNMKLPF